MSISGEFWESGNAEDGGVDIKEDPSPFTVVASGWVTIDLDSDEDEDEDEDEVRCCEDCDLSPH